MAEGVALWNLAIQVTNDRVWNVPLSATGVPSLRPRLCARNSDRTARPSTQQGMIGLDVLGIPAFHSHIYPQHFLDTTVIVDILDHNQQRQSTMRRIFVGAVLHFTLVVSAGRMFCWKFFDHS